MTECKHGLKTGCVYCHAPASARATPRASTSRGSSTSPKRATRSSRLSEQMNDRMTALKRRLREIRGG